MTGLSVRGATVRRSGRLALEDVTFSAPAAGMTAVLGRAGAGKTTLLATIAGRLKLERGVVLVGGVDVTRLRAGRRGVSLLAPGSALPAAAGLLVGMRRLVSRQAAPGAARVLQELGLAEAAGRAAGTLSHGEALLALTAARLLGHAPVLLVDEAGMGLDRDGVTRLLGILRAQVQAGRTVLVATRDPAIAFAADHLVLLDGGRVLQSGSPASLYAEPADAACAHLTGPANILAGQVREVRAGGFVWMAPGGRFIQMATPDAARPALGSAVSLCLRPERIALLGADEPADNAVEAVAVWVRAAGAGLHVGLDTALGEIVAAVPSWGAGPWPAAARAGWSRAASTILA